AERLVERHPGGARNRGDDEPGGPDGERASNERMAGAAGREPAADEQAAERERDERDRRDRTVVHLGMRAAREDGEDDDAEERDEGIARVGDGDREDAAEPERLQHAPARPGRERADAIEDDAE